MQSNYLLRLREALRPCGFKKSAPILLLVMLLTHTAAQAWTSTGHKLAAQIAYDNLSPDAKKMCAQLMRVDIKQLNARFVSASIWLDSIRKKNKHQFDMLHYIDIPFSRDNSKLPPISKVTALTAIRQAQLILSSKKASMTQKALNLRILIHVVADIHQPLHTSTQISKMYPQGDQGGNLFPLVRSSAGSNLHRFWDNGGGVFLEKNNKKTIAVKALALESQWPCAAAANQIKAEDWVHSAHQLAITQAYSIAPHTKPDEAYQKKTQALSEQQISLAGCRLAYMLNRIAQNIR